MSMGVNLFVSFSISPKELEELRNIPIYNFGRVSKFEIRFLIIPISFPCFVSVPFIFTD